MDRIINVNVGGNYISKDGKNAGVKGEANVTFLRISFDESWDDFAKKVVFIDSHGVNAVNVLLGLSMLENMNESERVYLVPIPAEPLAEAGSMTFIIEGTKDDKVKKSFQDKLDVKDAPDSSEAAPPVPPTPSEVEQMQADIEAIKEDVSVAARAGAEAVAARDEILGMTVSAETLAAGSKATVENIGADGKAHLRFGLPKGKDGKDGVSIARADVDKNNNLILTFTDGTKKNAGSVLSDTMAAALDGSDSVAFNDKEGNKANVANAFVAGKNNRAILRGFRITGVDALGGLYLDSVEGLAEGTLVAYFKETEGGIVRYRDKVASLGGVCKQCMKDQNIGSNYPIAFATPTIDGNDNDAAWSKAPFVKEPTVVTNNVFDNASLKITYDSQGWMYFRLYVKLTDRVNHNNIEITIRPPYANDIKARFFGDDAGIALQTSGSNITEADYHGETYITRKTTDNKEFLFEIKVPAKAQLPFFGGADVLVNVGCYFTRAGSSSTASFNWGGIGVNWSPDIKWDMTNAIKGWLVGHCDHGELVMFEDQIKTGIVNGEITLVDAEDAYYANGAYIIARATDKGWEDIGTAAYSERETIGSTELTTKDGSHVTAFIAGRGNIVSIDAAAFGHDNDALGYQAVSFGRYNRVYGDRGTAFGYKNTVTGHEAAAFGVKNGVDGYAGHVEGESNLVNGDYGHGEGWDNEVNGCAAHVEGIANKGYGQAQHVQGMFNEIDYEGKYLHIVGNGTDYDKRSNAHTIDREGNAWFAGEITYGSGRKKVAEWIAGEVRTLLAPNIDADWLPCSGGLVRSSYGGLFDEAPLNVGVSEQVTEAIVPDHITDSGVGYMVRDGALYVSYDVTAMPWQKVLPTCSCSKVMGYGNVVLYYSDGAVYDLSTREKCFDFTGTDENMLSGTWISGANNALLVYSKNYSVDETGSIGVATMLCDKTGILESRLKTVEGDVGDSGAFFGGAYYFTVGESDGHHLFRYVRGAAAADSCNLGAGKVSHVYGAYDGKIIVGRLLFEYNPQAAGMIDHTLYVMAYDPDARLLSDIASVGTTYIAEEKEDAFTAVLMGNDLLCTEDANIYKIDVSTGAKEEIKCDRYGKAYAWKDPAKQCAVFACKDAYGDVTADCLFHYYEGTMYRLPVASFADGYGSYIYVGGVAS